MLPRHAGGKLRVLQSSTLNPWHLVDLGLRVLGSTWRFMVLSNQLTSGIYLHFYLGYKYPEPPSRA